MRCAVGKGLDAEENPELRGYRGPKIWGGQSIIIPKIKYIFL